MTAYYLGLVVTKVGIGLNLRAEAAGIATYRHRRRGNAYRDLIVVCAGPIAEARFRGRSLDNTDDDSGAGTEILQETGFPPSFLSAAKQEAVSILGKEDVWSLSICLPRQWTASKSSRDEGSPSYFKKFCSDAKASNQFAC